MSQRPTPPPGYRYDWLGRLREDEDYYPPPGYRLARNFFTNRLELHALISPEVHAVEGITSKGSHGNAAPKPAPFGYFGTGLGHVDGTPIDPAKIGKGIDFFEGTSRPVPGSDKHKRDQAMFG